MLHESQHATMNTQDVQERLRDLERQILCLRRELQPSHEELPKAPFFALETRVEGQSYLLRIDPIREIVQVVWPTPLPEAPSWIRGSFRYGPMLLPMIDLAQRLTGRPTRLVPELCLIIVEAPKWIGLLVPPPEGVVEVDHASVAAPDPEISLSPWILGTVSQHGERGAHLLSGEGLGREFITANK